MKYTIITGEPSGEKHGANLMREILSLDPKGNFQYTGGQSMDQIGGEKIMDISKMAFMGFVEVFINLISIYKIQKTIKNSIKSFDPDVIIFVDYPGLNLRLARWAKHQGIKTVYYILPKAWAWKSSRTKFLKKFVDINLSIFPFEVSFFKNQGLEVQYVGNPSMTTVDRTEKQEERRPIIALFPGSRVQEIKRILPVMLESVEVFHDYKIIISKAPNLDRALFDEKFEISEDYDGLLNSADVALVTSGTATLEAAISNIPQVVIYRSSWISMKIARFLVKLKYISLVNLIADQPLVKELIQEDATVDNIRDELNYIVSEGRQSFISKYDIVRGRLGNKNAAKNAASIIYQGVTS